MKDLLRSVLFLLVAVAAFAQAGIDVREPNTELVVTELPPDPPGPLSMEPIRVFPQLTFSRSVLLVELVDPTVSSTKTEPR